MVSMANNILDTKFNLFQCNGCCGSDSGGSWASMSVASAVCYKALFLFPEQQPKERHVTVQSLQKMTEQNPLTHPCRELMFGSLIHISIAAVFPVHELPQVMLLR